MATPLERAGIQFRRGDGFVEASKLKLRLHESEILGS